MSESIEFPKEDQAWIALQQKVIDVAQKPIEELERTEIRALSSCFSPHELEQIRTYRKKVGLDVRELPIIAAANRPWEERECNKTFRWISYFTDYIRCTTSMLEQIHYNRLHERRFDDILKDFAPRLFKFIDGSGAPRHSNTEKMDSLLDRIKINLPNVSPTDEGYNLLAKLHGKLYKQWIKIEKECKAKRNPPPPPPLGPWPLPENGWLYEVEINHIRANKKAWFVVWALNEQEAERKAVPLFKNYYPQVELKQYPFRIERVFKERRGSCEWNQYFRNGGKCE